MITAAIVGLAIAAQSAVLERIDGQEIYPSTLLCGPDCVYLVGKLLPNQRAVTYEEVLHRFRVTERGTSMDEIVQAMGALYGETAVGRRLQYDELEKWANPQAIVLLRTKAYDVGGPAHWVVVTACTAEKVDLIWPPGDVLSLSREQFQSMWRGESIVWGRRPFWANGYGLTLALLGATCLGLCLFPFRLSLRALGKAWTPLRRRAFRPGISPIALILAAALSGTVQAQTSGGSDTDVLARSILATTRAYHRSIESLQYTVRVKYEVVTPETTRRLIPYDEEEDTLRLKGDQKYSDVRIFQGGKELEQHRVVRAYDGTKHLVYYANKKQADLSPANSLDVAMRAHVNQALLWPPTPWDEDNQPALHAQSLETLLSNEGERDKQEMDIAPVDEPLFGGNVVRLKAYSMTVWIDMEHGAIPRKTEVRRKDGTLSYCIQIPELQELGGVPFPARIEAVHYTQDGAKDADGNPKIAVRSTAVVPKESLRMNDLTDDDFKVRMAAGTKIYDALGGLTYTVKGEGDDDYALNLDELLGELPTYPASATCPAAARPPAPLTPPKPLETPPKTPEAGHFKSVVLGGGAVSLLAVAALRQWHRRLAKRDVG